MERPERPERPVTRIPSGSLRTPSSRAPATRTPLSTLGKRAAGEAGLSDDPLATRRALHTSQGKQTSLERKVVELERQLRQRDEDIEEQRREIGQIKSERAILFEGETKAKEQLKNLEEEYMQDKADSVRKYNHYRQKARQLEAQLLDLHSQHQALTSDNARLKRECGADVKLLEDRLSQVEGERDALKGWQRKAEGLAAELEEARRQNEEGARDRNEVAEEKRANDLIHKEVQRQAQNLIALQNKNDDLQSEVLALRKRNKEVEEREGVAKRVERELRSEIRSLNVQVQRGRHEIDALTATFPPGDNENAALQDRLSTLGKLHAETKAQLAEQVQENDSLHARLATLADESENAVFRLTRELEDAKRELRWANQGRSNAESREKLLSGELAALRSSGGSSSPDVRHLEALVESYRTELEGMARDSRATEENLARGAGLVKADALADAEGVIKSLREEIANLQESIEQLSSANAALDQEVAALMRRVWSGEFGPRERCLELGANPAAKVRAVRTAELESLKAENAALIAKSDNVPRETYDRLLKEKETLEAAHEKRLRRLKEIFGAKSREFLEAVYSLLGWRIKFDENGADIRLTSMYAPKGKMGLTLKFTSNEGHFGTMAMMGGMARSLEEARDFWVTERQSIPGFLAQVTTEMFEKTTLGRAAGYVGLE